MLFLNDVILSYPYHAGMLIELLDQDNDIFVSVSYGCDTGSIITDMLAGGNGHVLRSDENVIPALYAINRGLSMGTCVVDTFGYLVILETWLLFGYNVRRAPVSCRLKYVAEYASLIPLTSATTHIQVFRKSGGRVYNKDDLDIYTLGYTWDGCVLDDDGIYEFALVDDTRYVQIQLVDITKTQSLFT